MAIFKSLKKIINQNPKNLQSIITKKTLNFSLLSRNPSLSHSPFLSPLSNDLSITTFHHCGPLFLSSHPWMLSLFATPLLVRSDVVLGPPRLNLGLGLGLGLGFVKPVVDGGQRREKVYDEKAYDEKVGGGNRGGFVESFVNLPNFVSFSRLLSGPLLGWMILKGWYLPAFAGLAISGATDWLDGYLARRMGINSVVGSYVLPRSSC